MKRLIDIVISCFALALLSPLLIVICIFVRINMGSPVLFRQMRPGLSGKPFEMIKFRTMKNAYDTQGQLLSDSDRITSFGQLLRKSSMDELPELWNVLKGEMSLVGPRPLLVEYLPLYSATQRRRHEVRPGITGWAQINGRNAISWEDKFNYDVWYVDNLSLALDIKILASTIKKVFRGSDISAEGQVTMSRFTGSQE